jgi:hypothetical protein
MSEDGKRFTVTVRQPTASSLIEAAFILGGVVAEWLVPRPAALPLAVVVIVIYLVWSLGPQVILHYHRKRSQPGNPGNLSS